MGWEVCVPHVLSKRHTLPEERPQVLKEMEKSSGCAPLGNLLQHHLPCNPSGDYSYTQDGFGLPQVLIAEKLCQHRFHTGCASSSQALYSCHGS